MFFDELIIKESCTNENTLNLVLRWQTVQFD